MKTLSISLFLLCIGFEVVLTTAPSLTQPSNCPSLNKGSFPEQRDRFFRNSITRYYNSQGRQGRATNLVVIGKYGMGDWFTENTATPMAIIYNGNNWKAYILDRDSSTEKLVSLGFPRPTAECLKTLLNESGI